MYIATNSNAADAFRVNRRSAVVSAVVSPIAEVADRGMDGT